MQSAKYPLLISLKTSPLALCNHTEWVNLNSVIDTFPSNYSYLTSANFYDSDSALAGYLAGLKNYAQATLTNCSISERGVVDAGVQKILRDLIADAGVLECPPCEVVTTMRTFWDIGSLIVSIISEGTGTGKGNEAPPISPPDPPPTFTCTVQRAPDSTDHPCKVICEDCAVWFGATDSVQADG